MTGRAGLSQSASSLSLSHYLPQLSSEQGDSADSSSDNKPTDLRTVLSQVVDWLQEEKSKRHKRHAPRPHSPGDLLSTRTDGGAADDPADHDQDLALEKLERILAGFHNSSAVQAMSKLPHKPSTSQLRKGSIARKFKRGGSIVPASSDTEFLGDDILVPNVEASLDNTKTLAFTGGSADADTSESAKRHDHEYWVTFKQDIVRLTHTLKLKGWRRIPIENAAEIDVARLSGALTNAVYVVKPPKILPEPSGHDESNAATGSRRRPIQLLLRIYGPQVEHLIDREAELAILRRLARKHIGPRLLGSFHNGRFEEFLHAKTLSANDLRDPETSKQIAKRMKELHEGIELLQSELEAGPAVFINWDKWVDRCEKVITWLDHQVHLQKTGQAPASAARYTRRGLICGVEWPVFRKAYEKYRKRLIEDCGGKTGIRKKLVFAHNDTQYGNLMRLQPTGDTPLLQPSNQHKQLVVIDFEYASQNMAGLEFANHFTEWCYNYHHPETSFACNTNVYPTPSEQYRFVRSYVMHRPQFNPAASATPKMEGREKTNISDFVLDARTPQEASGIDYDAEEKAREIAMEEEIQCLLRDTRMWRTANSAQWVAWGIVQAKVPELDHRPKKSSAGANLENVNSTMRIHARSDPLSQEEKQLQEDARHDRPEGRAQENAHAEGNAECDGDEDEEFDYLAYAQERAMFFWGDCLQMGIVKKDELPEALRPRIKIVNY